MDEEISNTVQVSSKSKKMSLGRECAAFGCSSRFYKNDGSKSGIQFFQFPKSNPDKLRWCNLINVEIAVMVLRLLILPFEKALCR